MSKKWRGPQGPAGEYFCALSEGLRAEFEKLVSRYGLVRNKKSWSNGSIVTVLWCRRDRDGVITFLIDDDCGDYSEHDGLAELEQGLAGVLEALEIMSDDTHLYEAVEDFDREQARREGWDLEDLEGAGLSVVIYGPRTGRWNMDDDALDLVVRKAGEGSVYHRLALGLVKRWEAEHNADEDAEEPG